jgi:hypothetical protein
MSRRAAVLLTPLRSTSIRSLFLARLAQSCGASRKGCALFYPDPRGVHQSVTHPASFQSLPHSLCVYPGWHQERSSFPALGFQLSTLDLLTPLNATLTANLRVLPCFGRNCPSTSPLDATLTKSSPVTPLSATLTKKPGEAPVAHRHQVAAQRRRPVRSYETQTARRGPRAAH